VDLFWKAKLSGLVASDLATNGNYNPDLLRLLSEEPFSLRFIFAH